MSSDKTVECENERKTAAAAALPEKTPAAEPNQFEAQFELGVLCFQQGRLEDAARHFEKAAAAQPAAQMAWFNLALILLRLGRPRDALDICDKALAIYSGWPFVLNCRGNALRALGRSAEAVATYQKTVALQPDHGEALINCAATLRTLRRFEEALAACDQALALPLALRSDMAAIDNLRGAVLLDLDRPAEALVCCDRALALDPELFDAANNRGNALIALHRPSEAVAAFDAALAIDPARAIAWANRATALLDVNRPLEALASLDKAVALDPDFSGAHGNRAVVLGELGRAEEALAATRRAIELDPDAPRQYYHLALAQRLSPDDPHVAKMWALAEKIETFEVKEQIYLHYALAKYHADHGEQEAVFQRLRAGSALKRSLIGYDESAVLAAMDRTASIFTRELLVDKGGCGDDSVAPLFIVGMPRSGSSLVEQILASHAGVIGLGEIDAFLRAIDDGCGGNFQFPDAVGALTAAQMRQVGASYISRAAALAPGAERLVDKMLDNFRLVGLIHLALPRARFIHVRRDPIETCMSSFSKLFADGLLGFTYDLAELGRFFRAYEKLMAHWSRVLPEGVLLDLRYEDLVADLEGQTRRLAAFCDILWDPRCLEFHKTERQVRTASKFQVRQPLFNGSNNRWSAIDAHLGPLKAELQC